MPRSAALPTSLTGCLPITISRQGSARPTGASPPAQARLHALLATGHRRCDAHPPPMRSRRTPCPSLPPLARAARALPGRGPLREYLSDRRQGLLADLTDLTGGRPARRGNRWRCHPVAPADPGQVRRRPAPRPRSPHHRPARPGTRGSAGPRSFCMRTRCSMTALDNCINKQYCKYIQVRRVFKRDAGLPER
jgi:hypothetical protein